MSTVIRFKCPHCGKTFRGGPEMRLGPARVKCGGCGGAFDTGLKNWNEYAPPERRPLVAKELLDPYVAANPLDWFFTHLILMGLVVALALGANHFLLLRLDPVAVVLIAALGIYPALILVRLIRRIAICKRFARTGQPPVWN